MYIADLHIHSKYSRATSKDCVPEHLDFWAKRKGIQLIGTGDFTHPAWREELKEKLIPAEQGLYQLKPEYQIEDRIAGEQQNTRFVLSGEISSIYKKNGKVRKVHNVILLPSLEAAEELSKKLEAIGNIHSDGRPILGLDSHDLLEITLESCPDAIFIPAHIWTPHFSLFGAFSGFDTIEECFEDLTPYIHALETGLSSDPPMNWMVSALDRFTLVSNSDAHSPQKLGREANLLETELSYQGLYHAIQEGKQGGFAGTIEFFPEEGKYHYDGHRNCNLCLKPSETVKFGGKCPICGKKITIGVQHRVEQLADREEGFQLPGAAYFESLVPLPEVIAASIGVSSISVKVKKQYETMLREIGPEFYILREAPLEQIGQVAGVCVQEGIKRLRQGKVTRVPGYDGEYGTIQLLTKEEIDGFQGQINLLSTCGQNFTVKKEEKPAFSAPQPTEEVEQTEKNQEVSQDILSGLNQQQLKAVTTKAHSVAVIAGPGTGKTKTLISRIAYLVERCNVKPAEITAVTFTNKAAEEMRQRLEQQFGSKRTVRSMTIGTFHSICMELLEELEGNPVHLLDESEAMQMAGDLLRQQEIKYSPRKFLQELSKYKNGIAVEDLEQLEPVFQQYQAQLQQQGRLDFDDLLLRMIELSGKLTPAKKKRFHYLMVDEYQDINQVQRELIGLWSQHSKGFMAIGDPDQSIYGFRGSDAHCFEQLKETNPDTEFIRLTQNYRSTPEIIRAAQAAIAPNPSFDERILEANKESGEPVSLLYAETELSEGIYIAKEINRLVGGIDMLDTEMLGHPTDYTRTWEFSDIAVLYRTHHQARILEKCFQKEGIPYIVKGRDDFLMEESVRGTIQFFRFLWDESDHAALSTSLKLIWNCPEDIIQYVVSQLEKQNLLELEEDFAKIGHLQQWLQAVKAYQPLIKKQKPWKLLQDWCVFLHWQDSKPLKKLEQMAVFYPDMPAFLQALLLGEEGDLARNCSQYDAGAVTLMTLHGSKGLEFPIVFLAGLQQGCLPLESEAHPADLEEERRLFYVGMTRAKDKLVMTAPKEYSQFTEGFPEGVLETGQAHQKKAVQAGKQLNLLDFI